MIVTIFWIIDFYFAPRVESAPFSLPFLILYYLVTRYYDIRWHSAQYSFDIIFAFRKFVPSELFNWKWFYFVSVHIFHQIFIILQYLFFCIGICFGNNWYNVCVFLNSPYNLIITLIGSRSFKKIQNCMHDPIVPFLIKLLNSELQVVLNFNSILQITLFITPNVYKLHLMQIVLFYFYQTFGWIFYGPWALSIFCDQKGLDESWFTSFRGSCDQ